jgi:L-fucose mutarotase
MSGVCTRHVGSLSRGGAIAFALTQGGPSVLKNIHPLLNAELLGHLQAMGHGDELAVVDRNFPAASTAQRLVTLSGNGVAEVAAAIFSVFPVDTFVEPAVHRMGPVGDVETVLPVHRSFHEAVEDAEARVVPIAALERFEFYRRARQAYLVVATTEDQPYGCFLVTKGVV